MSGKRGFGPPISGSINFVKLGVPREAMKEWGLFFVWREKAVSIFMEMDR